MSVSGGCCRQCGGRNELDGIKLFTALSDGQLCTVCDLSYDNHTLNGMQCNLLDRSSDSTPNPPSNGASTTARVHTNEGHEHKYVSTDTWNQNIGFGEPDPPICGSHELDKKLCATIFDDGSDLGLPRTTLPTQNNASGAGRPDNLEHKQGTDNCYALMSVEGGLSEPARIHVHQGGLSEPAHIHVHQAGLSEPADVHVREVNASPPHDRQLKRKSNNCPICHCSLLYFWARLWMMMGTLPDSGTRIFTNTAMYTQTKDRTSPMGLTWRRAYDHIHNKATDCNYKQMMCQLFVLIHHLANQIRGNMMSTVTTQDLCTSLVGLFVAGGQDWMEYIWAIQKKCQQHQKSKFRCNGTTTASRVFSRCDVTWKVHGQEAPLPIGAWKLAETMANQTISKLQRKNNRS